MGASIGTLSCKGAQLQWHLWGEVDTRPLVVLSHGGAMDHHMWAAQVEALSAEFPVLTYDLRGHGHSECQASDYSCEAAAEDLAALLDHIEADGVVLVGHSVGATISQLVAQRRPQRVIGMVGIGAMCATLPATLVARLRQSANPVALKALGQKRVREMFADMAGVKPEVKAYARSTIARLDDEHFEAVIREGFGQSRPVRAGYRLAAPLLLLQGDHEPYRAFQGRTRDWIERDSGELVVVPNAAHNSNQDAPEFVNSQLLGFMRALPGAA